MPAKPSTRWAFISDLHGNLVALEAVLADIQRQAVDGLACLGDVATLGPQPRAVLHRLAALGCPCVAGNHDIFLLDFDQIHAYTQETWVMQAVQWCQAQLGEAEWNFLRTFQPQLTLQLSGRATVLCYHGSPRSAIEGLFADTPPGQVAAMLAGHAADLYVGGHTHAPMLRQWQGRWLVNAGSVGQAFAQLPGPDLAPRLLLVGHYALVTCRDETLEVAFRQVPLDLDALRQAAAASAWPEAERWFACWEKPSYK